MMKLLPSGRYYAEATDENGWRHAYEWRPDETGKCDWEKPSFHCFLRPGESRRNSKPVAAELADLTEVSTEPAIAPQTQSCAVEPAVDLLGNRIASPIVPHRQLNLFDKTECRRTVPGTHAIVLRENGEIADGRVDHINQWKTVKQFTFTAHETGKMYTIPLRCCAVTWAGVDKTELLLQTN